MALGGCGGLVGRCLAVALLALKMLVAPAGDQRGQNSRHDCAGSNLCRGRREHRTAVQGLVDACHGSRRGHIGSGAARNGRTCDTRTARELIDRDDGNCKDHRADHAEQDAGKTTVDKLAKGILWATGYLLIAILVVFIGYMLYKGLPVLTPHFLFSASSDMEAGGGIGGQLFNTFYILFLSMVVSGIIAVGAAIYLNEYAKPGKLVTVIIFATETLAGIPSIIFGLFGMLFFGQLCHMGYSLLTGSLTLTLMVLPLVTRNTQEALKTVPDSFRTGAVGLGAGKWYTIRTILLPSAMPGIVTGVILAIGRIIGESAALLFTAGSAHLLPKTFDAFLEKIFHSGGTLTIQLYLSASKGEFEVAFGIAVVLLVIVLLINFGTKRLAKKLEKH